MKNLIFIAIVLFFTSCVTVNLCDYNNQHVFKSNLINVKHYITRSDSSGFKIDTSSISPEEIFRVKVIDTNGKDVFVQISNSVINKITLNYTIPKYTHY